MRVTCWLQAALSSVIESLALVGVSPYLFEQLQHDDKNKRKIAGPSAVKPRISLLKVLDIETEAPPGTNYGNCGRNFKS